MAISQVTTRDTQLEKQRIAKLQLTLTNQDNTLEPAIAGGSVVGVGGSLYVFSSDEAITGWSGIGNNTDCYIKLVPGAIMIATFVTAAPTWSDAKQGWYNGNDRYVAGLHRGATAAAYEDKWVYKPSQDNNASHRFYGDGTVDFDDGVKGNLDVGGAVSAQTVTAAGTVSAEQLTTTDDLTVANNANIGGLLTVNNSVSGVLSTFIRFDITGASNAEIYYIEVDSTETQDDVYDAFRWSGSVDGKTWGCHGRFGASWVHHAVGVASNQIALKDIDDVTLLTCTDGSASAIGSDLKMFAFGPV